MPDFTLLSVGNNLRKASDNDGKDRYNERHPPGARRQEMVQSLLTTTSHPAYPQRHIQESGQRLRSEIMHESETVSPHPVICVTPCLYPNPHQHLLIFPEQLLFFLGEPRLFRRAKRTSRRPISISQKVTGSLTHHQHFSRRTQGLTEDFTGVSRKEDSIKKEH